MRELVYAHALHRAGDAGRPGRRCPDGWRRPPPVRTLTATVGPDGLAGALASGGRRRGGVRVRGDAHRRDELPGGRHDRLRRRPPPALRHRRQRLPRGQPRSRRAGTGRSSWRVDGGEGQFAGASGLITSNFVLGEDLAVTDHHLGVLHLP